jgi:hypothetical protein
MIQRLLNWLTAGRRHRAEMERKRWQQWVTSLTGIEPHD